MEGIESFTEIRTLMEICVEYCPLVNECPFEHTCKAIKKVREAIENVCSNDTYE